MTSEMINVINRPARQACANLPPLIRLSCLRTVLSSSMLAPAPLKCFVTACLSASVMPSTGAGSKAEPPPESRQKHKSCLPNEPTSSKIRSVPKTPAAVGSFIPAGRAPCKVMCDRVRTQSSGTFTQPDNCFAAATLASTNSIPAAMPAPALPAPTIAMRLIAANGNVSSPTINSSPSMWTVSRISRSLSTAATPAFQIARASSRSCR